MSWIVKFGDGRYYSKNVFWGGVDKIEDATKMTHKDACVIRNKLCQPRINLKALVVEYDLEEKQLTQKQTESLEKAENSKPAKVKTRELPSINECQHEDDGSMFHGFCKKCGAYGG